MQGIKLKSFDGTDKRYRGSLSSSAWSLCVGAGISHGIVPTWLDLTRQITNNVFEASYSDSEFRDVVRESSWGLDTFLQAAQNKLRLTHADDDGGLFSNILEKHLYDNLLSEARNEKLEECLCDALNYPLWLDKQSLQNLCNFFDQRYSDTTLVKLSRILAITKATKKSPQAIINFNADTLLSTLVNIYQIKDYGTGTGIWNHPSLAFKRINRGVRGIPSNGTPIFHCHGSIAPSYYKKVRKNYPRDSREYLVFVEDEYLSIANKVANWAQSLFLFFAQSSRLLIIGHSLSDPNIRKWLAWSWEASYKEISFHCSDKSITPRNIWITTKPATELEMYIKEISVMHLGVRICWLDDWKDIDVTLQNLLGL